MSLTRAAALGLAALAGYAAVVVTVPGHASAATAYRYWAYYVAPAHSTSWQYSQRGPASEYPVDGEVQGWRFAVQLDEANGLLPGRQPDFGTLCTSSPPKAGEIRVGVVIDFGLARDAPAHEKPPAGIVSGCVYVGDNETGTNVLAAAAAIRIGTGADAGLVCGIDGYPKTECAVAVAANPAPPAPTPRPSPTPARSSPRASASTQASAPTPSTTASPLSTAAAIPSASGAATAIAESPVPAQSPVPTHAPDLAQSPVAPPSSAPAPAASALSLATLRSDSHRSHGVPATTIAGIALIAILGGAAIWRTRARRR